MMFQFDVMNLLNQYSLYAVPFLIMLGGLLLSRFTIGGNK